MLEVRLSLFWLGLCLPWAQLGLLWTWFGFPVCCPGRRSTQRIGGDAAGIWGEIVFRIEETSCADYCLVAVAVLGLRTGRLLAPYSSICYLRAVGLPGRQGGRGAGAGRFTGQ